MSNYTNNQITEDHSHVWNKILKFIPENSLVLDIGCSSGNLGEFLKVQKHCTVDGVEPDQADAKLAAKKLQKVWNKNIEEATKDINTKYDVLIFADVLEHLINPSDVLVAVKSLLKPTGCIVFSVPNMAHISVRLALLRGEWKYTETGLLDKTHLHYWDIDTVRDAFSKAHMNILEIDSTIQRYPDALIKKRLEEVGLTADKKAFELLTGDEASAYEIVGCANVSKGSHKKITLPSSALHQDEGLLAHDLLKRVGLYKQTVKDLENRIHTIENSKAYKLARKLQNSAHAFKEFIRG